MANKKTISTLASCPNCKDLKLRLEIANTFKHEVEHYRNLNQSLLAELKELRCTFYSLKALLKSEPEMNIIMTGSIPKALQGSRKKKPKKKK
jgi:hypothetical protein